MPLPFGANSCYKAYGQQYLIKIITFELMNPIIRNVLALMLGAAVGGLVNGAIIMISGNIIPPPAGVDVTTEAGLKAGLHLFEPKHFLMPFLAHAIGTFVGALTCARIAVSMRMVLALMIGVLFFAGGAQMVMILPAPMWFNVTDLALAYIPMAFLAAKLVILKTPNLANRTNKD